MSLHTGSILLLDSPQRLRAIANETRAQILRILEDGPASAKELSSMMEMSHGKIGHHLHVLKEAGFIGIVQERPVRAVVERFYGLTYDRLQLGADSPNRLRFALSQAAREASEDQPFEPPAILLTARVSSAAAKEFHRRLIELGEEFAESDDREADTVFGFTGSVFLTDTPKRTQG